MRNKTGRPGVALLVVLCIVMAVTVLSLGYLSRSDVEVACSQNMVLRSQMDYLAESGLEHARGLILNPQNVTAEYWSGATQQQLVAGSDDYYDVDVVKLGECNYQINSIAYRKKGSEQIGRSSLQAELRLDPCIVYWQTNWQSISSAVTINGDVYCADNLAVEGIVNGDVFAAGSITDFNNVLGQKNAFVTDAPVTAPGLDYSDFASSYYIGSTAYSVGIISTDELNGVTLGPTMSNPAGVYYRDGSLNLNGNVHINGMLVVKENVAIGQNANVTITAVKNFPALLVDVDIIMDDSNDPNDNAARSLSITGLAQAGGQIDMADKMGSSIDVFGALYVLGGGIVNTSGCSVNITASPDRAAIAVWPSGTEKRWSCAAAAFFKNIQRP